MMASRTGGREEEGTFGSDAIGVSDVKGDFYLTVKNVPNILILLQRAWSQFMAESRLSEGFRLSARAGYRFKIMVNASSLGFIHE